MLEHLPLVAPVLGDIITNGFDALKGDAGPILLAGTALSGGSSMVLHMTGHRGASDHTRSVAIAAVVCGALVYGGDFFVHLFHP